MKPLKDIKEVKKKLDETMIKGLLEYVKNGTFPGNSPNSYMDAYTTVQSFADEGDQEGEALYNHHNKIIQGYILDCHKKIKGISSSQLVDSFLDCTSNINFLIYWMNRIFTYLDRFFVRSKGKTTLAKTAIDIYHTQFFDPVKSDLFKELGKLIEDDRNRNIESRPKIKAILKIVDDLDLMQPRISKENNKISWSAEEKSENKNGKETADSWYNGFFKRETENYASKKAQNDIKEMSAPEYITSTLQFLDEEKTRQDLYINKRYHQKINEINSKYLVGQNAKSLGEMETGIKYMFQNKKNDELKKAYILLKKHPESDKIITEHFGPYIRQRGADLSSNKELLKDPKKFVPELIKLKSEMDGLVSECFANDALFQDTKHHAFSMFMGKPIYSKQIAIYADFCLRSGIKGKSDEEIEKMLDEIVDLFNCLQNKIEFQNETRKRMSERLIKKTFLSEEAEKNFISKLKQRSAVTYVNSMNDMISDLEKNKTELEAYRNTSKYNGKPSGIKFETMVVSQGAWEINQKNMEKIEIPKYLQICLDDFENFYLKNHNGQKLIWCLGLSKLEIQYLSFNKKYQSTSTLIQYLALIQLEKYGTLSLKRISELLGYNVDAVVKDIPGLVYNPSFNKTSNKDKGVITGNWDDKTKEFKDTTEISINKNFQINSIRFSTMPLALKKSPNEQRAVEIEEMNNTRKLQENVLQATMTRIMKSRIGQKVTHVWLVSETAKQIELFKAQPQQIKENIEKLIEKSIIKRSETDRNCYEYIA